MATDIREDSPLMSWAPRTLKPYLVLMRVDRPIGTLLILLPCLWGLVLGLRTHKVPWHFWVVFVLGAFVMRSAGCVMNDLVDQRFDAQGTRTKGRPLAAGLLTSKQALGCLSILLSSALALLLTLPPLCWGLGVLGLLLVITYPWMKRITYWPQIFLGLAMNWGLPMAVAAIEKTLTLSCGVLFLVGVGWTLIYDTLYAHQDIQDDRLLGVRSSALKLGARTKPVLMLVTLALVLACLFLGALEKPSLFFYAACLVGGASLMKILRAVDLEAPSSCLAAFKECQVFGWMILVALCVL